MKAERVLCLTATVSCRLSYRDPIFQYHYYSVSVEMLTIGLKATPKVCEDILKGFGVPESGLFKTPTYREK